MQQSSQQWAGAPVGPTPPPRDQAGVEPSAAPADPSLTKAGTILLLVGAIVSLAVLVFSLFMTVVMMLVVFTWFEQWMPPMFDMMPWPSMGGGVFVVTMLFSVVALIVVTVLHFVAWKMAKGGEHKRAGIFGIVAGSLGLVFASGTGIIGLLGGVFVLMAARETQDAQAPSSPAGAPPAETGPPRPEDERFRVR